MLFILVLLGIGLYAAFYFSFSSFTTADTAHSGTAISAYEHVQNMIFKLPASLPLAIMKVLLTLFIIYAIIDFSSSTMRRTRLRRDQAQRKQDLHDTLYGK